MKFDVIIGNPPYQEDDGGARASSRPIYNKFIDESKKLEPESILYITPSRWFAGGKGLDKFRESMINDKRIKLLVDYPDASDVFANTEIKGGVNYFLWLNDYEGPCKVINMSKGSVSSVKERYLKEEGLNTFIRYNKAVEILRKVQSVEKTEGQSSFANFVSTRKPFDFPTNFKDYHEKEKNKDDVKIYMNRKTAFVKRSQVNKNENWISAHKIYISMAYGAGESYPHQIINKPFYGEPNSVCTETYLFIGPFDNKVICENVISYINTKFFRFLVLLLKNTQHATKKVYDLVPLQDFNQPWTDEKLFKKYNLNESEIEFINSMVRPMD